MSRICLVVDDWKKKAQINKALDGNIAGVDVVAFHQDPPNRNYDVLIFATHPLTGTEQGRFEWASRCRPGAVIIK